MTEEDVVRNFPEGFTLQHTLRGHTKAVYIAAWSAGGQTLASGATDGIICVWNMQTGELLQTLQSNDSDESIPLTNSVIEHSSSVTSVAWSPDGHILAASYANSLIRLWNPHTGELLQEWEGHRGPIWSLAWSPDGQALASGSYDDTIRLWYTQTGKLPQTISGHAYGVLSVAWSPNGHTVASGSRDHTIRFWDPLTGKESQSRLKHTDAVFSIAWHPAGRMLASGSKDNTICLWNLETSSAEYVLEGHTSPVSRVSISGDGCFLASQGIDATRIWSIKTGKCVSRLDSSYFDYGPLPLAFHPMTATLVTPGEEAMSLRIWKLDPNILISGEADANAVNYINAKAVLVGESGVGKSGLGIRLAEKKFQITKSTHGAQFWQMPVPSEFLGTHHLDPIHAELTLWDLAGQSEYHLIHQMFLDDIDVALLLFDCSDAANPFHGVPYWAKVLKKQAPSHAVKYLISARCDVSPPTVDWQEINRVLAEYGLRGYLRTSALTGEGVDDVLRKALESVPWKELPRHSRPLLFEAIREYILERKSLSTRALKLRRFRVFDLNHPHPYEWPAARRPTDARDCNKTTKRLGADA